VVRDHQNRDDINALSTVAIALFTGTLWWVTWNMVGIARREREDFLRSVEAAEEANKISREALGSERRAWVAIESFCVRHPTTFKKDGVVFGFEVLVKNVGEIPALNVRIEIMDHPASSQNFRYRETRAKAISFAHNPIPPLGTTLFPRDEFRWRLTSAPDYPIEEYWRADGQGKADVVFFVIVSYQIMGAEGWRVTLREYEFLNIMAGTVVAPNNPIEMQPMPFSPNEIT
jgi:hypothetical protein